MTIAADHVNVIVIILILVDRVPERGLSHWQEGAAGRDGTKLHGGPRRVVYLGDAVLLASISTSTTIGTTTAAVTAPMAVQPKALRGTALAAVAFMLLQWYWFVTYLVLVAVTQQQQQQRPTTEEILK